MKYVFYFNMFVESGFSVFFLVDNAIRYLREDKPHGSAGGLYNFRDLILEDNPVFIFAIILPRKLHLLLLSLLSVLFSSNIDSLLIQHKKPNIPVVCDHYLSSLIGS